MNLYLRERFALFIYARIYLSFVPDRSHEEPSYSGCYSIVGLMDMNVRVTLPYPNREGCFAYCRENGYQYAGLNHYVSTLTGGFSDRGRITHPSSS